MSAVREIYEQQVRRLSPADRLALARLIMDDLIGQASRWPIDESDAWSDEDIEDVRRASLVYASQALGEEDDDTW
jgi:hypothetical protein